MQNRVKAIDTVQLLRIYESFKFCKPFIATRTIDRPLVAVTPPIEKEPPPKPKNEYNFEFDSSAPSLK